MRNPLNVAILGGGPAAAYSFRACRDVGIMPDVFAEKIVRTAPLGAFWLYWLPPDIGLQPEEIVVSSEGAAEEYSMSLWGKSLPSSFPEESHTTQGYDPRVGLQMLWNSLLFFRKQRFVSDEEIIALARKYDIVLQTFPTFESLTSQPYKEITVCGAPIESSINSVVYGGDCLRRSVLFGRVSYECAVCRPDCPFEPTHKVLAKKISPVAAIWAKTPAENVFLVGRYATWDRKMLSHECYSQTISAICRLI